MPLDSRGKNAISGGRKLFCPGDGRWVMGNRRMAEKRKLGELLIELGVSSAEAISAALGVQRQSNEKLGQILMRDNAIAPGRLGAALEVQSERRSPMRSRRLGEVLIDLGVVSKEAVAHALEVQAGHGRKLGQTLLELGLASEAAISEAIHHQKAEVSSLGHLLIRLGLITETQLAFALKIQSAKGGRLGETIVGLGQVDRETLDQTLNLQRLIRKGVSVALITAAMATAGASVAAASTSGDLAATSSGSATISVIIPERASFDIGPAGGGGDGGSSKIAVEGGQVDMVFQGASYLKGATTISAVGTGTNGEFVLQDASGDSVSFDIKSTNSVSGGDHIQPHQNFNLSDMGKLVIDLPGGNGAEASANTGAGSVYYGVVTMMVSPQ